MIERQTEQTDNDHLIDELFALRDGRCVDDAHVGALQFGSHRLRERLPAGHITERLDRGAKHVTRRTHKHAKTHTHTHTRARKLTNLELAYGADRR